MDNNTTPTTKETPMTTATTPHTPGPWYCTASSPDGSVYAAADHELIVPWSPLLSDRKMANARLIAAAPDLLDGYRALRHILATVSPVTHAQGEMLARALLDMDKAPTLTGSAGGSHPRRALTPTRSLEDLIMAKTHRSTRPLTEMGRALTALSGGLPTVLIRYPSGRYGLVGRIPMALTELVTGPHTPQIPPARRSMAWATESEAIAALLALGITHFQHGSPLAWYDAPKGA